MGQEQSRWALVSSLIQGRLPCQGSQSLLEPHVGGMLSSKVGHSQMPGVRNVSIFFMNLDWVSSTDGVTWGKGSGECGGQGVPDAVPKGLISRGPSLGVQSR